MRSKRRCFCLLEPCQTVVGRSPEYRPLTSVHGGRRNPNTLELGNPHNKMLEIMQGPQIYNQFELSVPHFGRKLPLNLRPATLLRVLPIQATLLKIDAIKQKQGKRGVQGDVRPKLKIVKGRVHPTSDAFKAIMRTFKLHLEKDGWSWGGLHIYTFTHMKYHDGITFIDRRAKLVRDNYTTMKEQAMECQAQTGEQPTIDELQLYLEAAGASGVAVANITAYIAAATTDGYVCSRPTYCTVNSLYTDISL
ncbi:hypothetical protein JCGZ_11190 [Jatropha curcas]|uniref:Uncharacterized protein n=1 Tax=Jatropha curcas TaxID=180498 RepID=A0A067KIK9_JATCU|nr:hypothetical protein JCGZ_11190 [Jatropha curcas]